MKSDQNEQLKTKADYNKELKIKFDENKLVFLFEKPDRESGNILKNRN